MCMYIQLPFDRIMTLFIKQHTGWNPTSIALSNDCFREEDITVGIQLLLQWRIPLKYFCRNRVSTYFTYACCICLNVLLYYCVATAIDYCCWLRMTVKLHSCKAPLADRSGWVKDQSICGIQMGAGYSGAVWYVISYITLSIWQLENSNSQVRRRLGRVGWLEGENFTQGHMGLEHQKINDYN